MITTAINPAVQPFQENVLRNKIKRELRFQEKILRNKIKREFQYLQQNIPTLEWLNATYDQ